MKLIQKLVNLLKGRRNSEGSAINRCSSKGCSVEHTDNGTCNDCGKSGIPTFRFWMLDRQGIPSVTHEVCEDCF